MKSMPVGVCIVSMTNVLVGVALTLLTFSIYTADFLKISNVNSINPFTIFILHLIKCF